MSRELRHGSGGASPPQDALLDEILLAPDRDHCPGARPVVSFSTHDEKGYLDAVLSRARAQVELSRRGRFHGEWAELDPALLPAGPWLASAQPAALAARWHAARPIVLPGLARD